MEIFLLYTQKNKGSWYIFDFAHDEESAKEKNNYRAACDRNTWLHTKPQPKNQSHGYQIRKLIK
jgi:hypothetical protein